VTEPTETERLRCVIIDLMDQVEERNAEIERLAAATKPPVVVGLTEEERSAIELAMNVIRHSRDRESKGGLFALRVLGDMLARDPGEYVPVRREDLVEAIESALEHEGDSAVHRLADKYCPEVRQAIYNKYAAIAKGGEPGALG
jgi:hypothetical protein